MTSFDAARMHLPPKFQLAVPLMEQPRREYKFHVELAKKMVTDEILEYIRDYSRTHPNEALAAAENMEVLLTNIKKTVLLAISEGRHETTLPMSVPVYTSFDRHGISIQPKPRKKRHPSLKKTLRLGIDDIPEHCEIKSRPSRPMKSATLNVESSFAELSIAHPKRSKTAGTMADFATTCGIGTPTRIGSGNASPAAQSPQPVRRAMTETVIDLNGVQNTPRHLQFPTTIDSSGCALHSAKSDHIVRPRVDAHNVMGYNSNKRDSLMKSARLSMSKVFKWNNVKSRSKIDIDYRHTSRGVSRASCGIGVAMQ